MTQSSKPISRRFRHLAIIAAIVGLGAAEVGTKVIVKTDVNVKAATNPFADPVETVPSDTVLEVLAVEGGYRRVRTPSGKEGYISLGDLPPRADLATIQGAGAASPVANDAALRGLQDDAKTYAQGKTYRPDGVQRMLDLGQSVTDNDLISFGKAGHVGPKDYRR